MTFCYKVRWNLLRSKYAFNVLWTLPSLSTLFFYHSGKPETGTVNGTSIAELLRRTRVVCKETSLEYNRYRSIERYYWNFMNNLTNDALQRIWVIISFMPLIQLDRTVIHLWCYQKIFLYRLYRISTVFLVTCYRFTLIIILLIFKTLISSYCIEIIRNV